MTSSGTDTLSALSVADQLADEWASSTGVRKELGELFGWFHESECLAGPVVEAGRDAGEVFGGVDGQVGAFGQVLAQ